MLNPLTATTTQADLSRHALELKLSYPTPFDLLHSRRRDDVMLVCAVKSCCAT
jgi:hypothetical protein